MSTESLFRDGHVVRLVPYGPEYVQQLSEWYYGIEYRFFFRDFSEALDIEGLKNLHVSMGRSGYVLLVILDKSNNQPLGLMTYTLEKPNARIFKFGIMLDVNCQHKTWAIDAINVLGDYLFNKRFAHKLVCEFSDADKHIHRITAQGGFTHEATLKEELFMDGKYIDEVRYSLHIDKYEELYGNYFS